VFSFYFIFLLFYFFEDPEDCLRSGVRITPSTRGEVIFLNIPEFATLWATHHAQYAEDVITRGDEPTVSGVRTTFEDERYCPY
jgi:hypothetical protein